MRAIIVKEFGEPEVMRCMQVKRPKPSAGQVVVRVEAAGINPVDTYIRSGVYPMLPQLPYTPGLDLAGEITAIGKGVAKYAVGDRIYASGSITGAYAEYTLCNETQVYPLPDSVAFSAGAAVGVPGATAWRALFIRGEAKPGDKVLVHGASGSVGSAAVQLARAAGLRVYGTASTVRGLANLEQYGITGLFNHKDPNYVSHMHQTVPGGFDVILEMVAHENLNRDLELLAPGGKVVIIGSRGKIEIDPRATMGRETEVRGLALFNSTPEETNRTHAALYAALEQGTYVPTIREELKLEEAPIAHQRVLESGNCGKIVLAPAR